MPCAWESLFDGSLTLSAAPTESNALAELPARRGVLLFTDGDGHPIQLVQTANLRGLSRSRLGEAPDETPRRKADLGAITQRVFYACCDNDLQRHLLYQRLTHAVFGKDWKKWLALPRRDYAAIDRGRAFPFFSVTGAGEATGTMDLFGPFPTRRAAARFCDCLNAAFELCRNPALVDSGTTQSCPYRQMQSCHGLCCQDHSKAEYALLVERAVRCAEGHVVEAIAESERQMKQAAAALQFEAAQLRKKQADRLRELLGPDFAWTGRLAALRALCIDRGSKIAPEGSKKKVRHYQVWRMDCDGATLLGMFAEDAADKLQGILDTINAGLPPYPYALNRQEHLATLGWFLYRKSRPGLWVNAATSLPSPSTILTDLATREKQVSPLPGT
jgi:hypothetical protein